MVGRSRAIALPVPESYRSWRPDPQMNFLFWFIVHKADLGDKHGMVRSEFPAWITCGL